MFQGRFQDLKNDLLENTADVWAHVNIPKGFNGLYHQDKQLFQVEDTSLYIQLQEELWLVKDIELSVYGSILEIGACWSSKIVWSRKKSFSTFALSVSSVKISPSVSSVGIEDLKKGI